MDKFDLIKRNSALKCFQDSINLLSSEEIDNQKYDEVIKLLSLDLSQYHTNLHERKIILSLLLTLWMRVMAQNYKLDYVYSHQFKGKKSTSIRKELYSIFNSSINPDLDDYNLAEITALANDIKAIMRERGWMEEEND